MMFSCFNEVLLLLKIDHCVLCTTDCSTALRELLSWAKRSVVFSTEVPCVDSCAVFLAHFLWVLFLVSKQHFFIHAVHERCLKKFVMCSLLTMRTGTRDSNVRNNVRDHELVAFFYSQGFLWLVWWRSVKHDCCTWLGLCVERLCKCSFDELRSEQRCDVGGNYFNQVLPFLQALRWQP